MVENLILFPSVFVRDTVTYRVLPGDPTRRYCNSSYPSRVRLLYVRRCHHIDVFGPTTGTFGSSRSLDKDPGITDTLDHRKETPRPTFLFCPVNPAQGVFVKWYSCTESCEWVWQSLLGGQSRRNDPNVLLILGLDSYFQFTFVLYSETNVHPLVVSVIWPSLYFPT